jgi:hypothetical protein
MVDLSWLFFYLEIKKKNSNHIWAIFFQFIFLLCNVYNIQIKFFLCDFMSITNNGFAFSLLTTKFNLQLKKLFVLYKLFSVI